MGEFDAIKPYDDADVPGVLQRLCHDRGLLDLLLLQRFGRVGQSLGGLLRPLLSWRLRRELGGIDTVDALQRRLEPRLTRLIRSTTLQTDYSGLERLQPGTPYLFVANHRDIVMDPAFVNYALFHAGHPTPRIAIGDNLLQRPFVADLMRLNKSFIVQRSITGRREKLAAYQQLSAYINHSLGEGQSVWIAQSEGRAKDGVDRTDSAIIKMFCMSRRQEAFDEVIRSLRLVPVSIAYEWDPCDLLKAGELEARERTGSYTKTPGEDDRSIAMGLTGYKGRVHVAFGTPLESGFTDARAVAAEVDRQVLGNYRLYPSNWLAFEHLPELPSLKLPDWRSQWSAAELAAELERFRQRLQACPENLRRWWLLQYANPVISHVGVEG